MTSDSDFERLQFQDADGFRGHTSTPGRDWLTRIDLHEVDGSTGEQRSPAGESLLVVLSGTFDLAAGGGGWLRRGLRAEPYQGRPVALFLPANTPWRASEGQGRIVVVSSKQPELPKAETKREEMAKKPLLQMSGSGKAFDPMTGDWKPKEAFLSSPEALLPRRFDKIDCGAARPAERLIGLDYKALSLRADELALSSGETVTPPAMEVPVSEHLVFVETDGVVEIDGHRITQTDRFAAFVSGDAPQSLRSVEGRAYLLHIGAGPKSD